MLLLLNDEVFIEAGVSVGLSRMSVKEDGASS